MDFRSRQRRIFESDRANRLIPYAGRDEFFVGRPRMSHVVENFRAWREFRKLDPAQLKYIGLFALARGGSNLVASQLHYHPNLFAMSERQESYERINYRQLLIDSLFGYYGLQDKKISQLKYLVFNKMNVKPGDTGASLWKPELVASGRFKFIFYVRNPLRVVASQHEYATRVSSWPDWFYTPESFRLVVDRTLALLNMFLETREINPEGAILTLHERFCRDVESEISALYRWIDPDLATPPDPEVARSFFRKLYCCNRAPVEAEGWLRCPSCGKQVRGHGGLNPLSQVSLERTMQTRLAGFFQEADLAYLRQQLGPDLADYWTNDTQHGYQAELPPQLIEGLRQPGGWSQVVNLANLTGLKR